MTYNAEPRYPVTGGEVEVGLGPLATEVARRGAGVVALDGPAWLDWERLVAPLAELLDAETLDVRRSLVAWDEVLRRTASSELPGDPVFARLADGSLRDLFDRLPARPEHGGVTIVFGPGAAFVPHDLLWYADMPKRLSIAAIRSGAAGNLGQPEGQSGSEQRLVFVDWPLHDRHKADLLASLDRLVDASDPARPRSLDGGSLRASLHGLARRPFRTRPSFFPGPWGGQWLRRTLGIETDAPNLAWSYELITPESGILLGLEPTLEVGFELLMAQESESVLGGEVADRFGRSFPIRFDYLDTLDGGHLSLQCHPGTTYAREIFGLDYTQDETYYVMETTSGAPVFLGLRADADLAAFRTAAEGAERGSALDAARFVQVHDAEQHRLYLIPAGTVHASGAGNVVLEISATPYLYTLRFYDWLRRDLDGHLRPVHVDHAFANLNSRRSGDAIRELMQEPRVVRRSDGFVELELGRHPDLFFAVHRLDFEGVAEDDTQGRFHVLNLVAGDRLELETEAGDRHPLSYAETIVVPASVGAYRLRRQRGGDCKVVKAFVV